MDKSNTYRWFHQRNLQEVATGSKSQPWLLRYGEIMGIFVGDTMGTVYGDVMQTMHGQYNLILRILKTRAGAKQLLRILMLVTCARSGNHLAFAAGSRHWSTVATVVHSVARLHPAPSDLWNKSEMDMSAERLNLKSVKSYLVQACSSYFKYVQVSYFKCWIVYLVGGNWLPFGWFSH